MLNMTADNLDFRTKDRDPLISTAGWVSYPSPVRSETSKATTRPVSEVRIHGSDQRHAFYGGGTNISSPDFLVRAGEIAFLAETKGSVGGSGLPRGPLWAGGAEIARQQDWASFVPPDTDVFVILTAPDADHYVVKLPAGYPAVAPYSGIASTHFSRRSPSGETAGPGRPNLRPAAAPEELFATPFFARIEQARRKAKLDSEDAPRRLAAALADAMKFAVAAIELPLPRISIADDGEVVMEWGSRAQKAIASFEGDGNVAYTLLIDGVFVPGQDLYRIGTGPAPDDLRNYVQNLRG